MRVVVLLAVAAAVAVSCAEAQRSFKLENDQFVKDGKPLQIISGSIHYHRIHPAYWKDRLLRVQSMGLNTVEFYIPWNFHEQFPGHYDFEGWADVGAFLALCAELDLNVLLRPGPYICGEWNFGGFPWWLASSQVAGGRTMQLRVKDPAYLAHVERWWSVLLPKLAPYLYHRGGPIVMVQVENEYGFCNDDHEYMRSLVATARHYLGPETLLFTTDPPNVYTRGSLPGDEVYTVVDFGPGTDVNWAFGEQKKFNPPGKSPPLCSEYYTGWLSHWGELMANTSSAPLVKTLEEIFSYGNGTGSVNFYMAHGGTNHGNWAGANLAGAIYQPHITSYDYDCPVSEAGAEGQPGIGGDNKFQILRDVIKKHTGVEPPAPLPPPPVHAYGKVDLSEAVSLLEALPQLYPGDGIITDKPDIMEEYGQMGGVMVYRTTIPAGALQTDSLLDVGGAVHDYAKVLVNGKLVGLLERNVPRNLTLAAIADDGPTLQLDIVVEAMGRVNFGCPSWDLKGLQSKDVKLNGYKKEVLDIG
ncbi:hypothetical protein WJX72_008691 [[Myrmecia] bisecta]|uniref:beta-galactosidase n=1 Tax=[Myrmecia] bisecta TaxID=41462 RepID=A0AAW1PGN8_9CHLO